MMISEWDVRISCTVLLLIHCLYGQVECTWTEIVFCVEHNVLWSSLCFQTDPFGLGI